MGVMPTSVKDGLACKIPWFSKWSNAAHHFLFFFFQAEDGIRDLTVTGVQTCALPIYPHQRHRRARRQERPDLPHEGGEVPGSSGRHRRAPREGPAGARRHDRRRDLDRKSTRLNSSHSQISYAVFCLKKKKDETAERLA